MSDAKATRGHPEREQLAIAIDAHKKLSEQLAAVLAADGWEKRAQSKQNIETARAAVEVAKIEAANYATDQALGKADAVTPTSIKEARAALQEAQDQLDVLEMVSASLKDKARGLRSELADAKIRVDAARLRVVRTSPEAISVCNRYKSLQRKLAGQRRLMEILAPPGWDVIHDPNDADDMTVPVAKWQGAIVALESDADAPLPAN